MLLHMLRISYVKTLFLFLVYYIYLKEQDMKKYSLINKSGDTITTINADSFEEAINIFCFRKKFDRHVLLHLFDVIRVEKQKN